MNRTLKKIIKIGLFGFGILSLLTALITLVIGFSQLVLVYFIISIACFSPVLLDWNKKRQPPRYKEKKRRQRRNQQTREYREKRSRRKERQREERRQRKNEKMIRDMTGYQGAYERERGKINAHIDDEFIHREGPLPIFFQSHVGRRLSGIPEKRGPNELGIRKDGSVDFGMGTFGGKKKRRKR